MAWFTADQLLLTTSEFLGGDTRTTSTADPTADEPLTAAPTAGSHQNPNELAIWVTTPVALVRDHPMPLDIVVVDWLGHRLDADTALEITLDPVLAAEAAGWVTMEPLESIGWAAALDPLRVELRAFGDLPCGASVGALEIHVAELDGRARTATERVPLPGVACNADAPPPAPDGLHETDTVCRDEDWEDLDEKLVDRDVEYHPECNPRPEPKVVRSEPEPAPEPAPEPEPEEPEPEPEPPEDEPSQEPATDGQDRDAAEDDTGEPESDDSEAGTPDGADEAQAAASEEEDSASEEPDGGTDDGASEEPADTSGGTDDGGSEEPDGGGDADED